MLQFMGSTDALFIQMGTYIHIYIDIYIYIYIYTHTHTHIYIKLQYSLKVKVVQSCPTFATPWNIIPWDSSG